MKKIFFIFFTTIFLYMRSTIDLWFTVILRAVPINLSLLECLLTTELLDSHLNLFECESFVEYISTA